MSTTYILARIIPTRPVSPDTFRDALQNVTITAFDKTVHNAGVDRELGTARNLAPTPDLTGPSPIVTPPLVLQSNPPGLEASIIQHLRPISLTTLSVATAVIVVDQAEIGDDLEYPTSTSFDVRLQISLTQDSSGHPRAVVRDQIVDFNIEPTKADLSTVQNDYASASTDIYLPIDVLDEPLPNDTAVIFPNRDGMPPNFEVLRDAINKVLLKDHPTGAPSVEGMTRFLTTAEAQQVASELIYNRSIDPPPTAPFPTANTGDSNPDNIFEDIYTLLDDSSTVKQETRDAWDLARQKFEGERRSYYALHNADILQLANYVFSVVTAVQAEQYTIVQGRMATLDVTLKDNISHTSATSTTKLSLSGSVVPPETEVAALDPAFVVPAPFFYALTTAYAISQAFETRIKVLLTSPAEALKDLMRQAIDAGVLHQPDPHGYVSETTLTDGGHVTINQHQAIRRLVALQPFIQSSSDRFVEPVKNADVRKLVTQWLDFDAPDEDLLNGFWTPLFPSREYLVAILEIIAPNQEALIAGILQFLETPSGAAAVDDLLQITEQAWLAFFQVHEGLLPARYVLGDLAARVHAFVVDVAKILFVPAGAQPAETHTPSGIPYFDGAFDRDVLAQFFASFTAFSLSSPFDADMRQKVSDAALELLGGRGDMASFVARAVEELWTLYRVSEPGRE